MTNKQGRIIYFNPSAETVFGVHANQVIGLSKEELSVAEPFYTFFTSRPKQVIVISGKQYILDLVDRENEFGTVYTLEKSIKSNNWNPIFGPTFINKGLSQNILSTIS